MFATHWPGDLVRCRFHPECLGYGRDEFRQKFFSGPNTKFLCDDCEAASPPVPEGDEEDHETSETIAF